jgi:hypothetical protein
MASGATRAVGGHRRGERQRMKRFVGAVVERSGSRA